VSRAKSPKSKRRRKKTARTDDLPLLTDWKLRGRVARAAESWVEEDEQPVARHWFANRFFGRVWNFVVGLSLLPFCWIFTDAIFNAFARAAGRGGQGPFWRTHGFLMFACGAALWMIWFVFCLCVWRQPRPLRAYVWGHELMHVLTARLFGGRITDYEITRDGGYIVTDRYNFLIALAPYLWPFAAVPVLAIWGIVGWMPEALYHREWFLGALGFTWAFHLSFTGWMIPIGQSDFAGPGRVFSLGLIYLFNVILLSALLVALVPEVTWRGYWRELSSSGISFYEHAIHFGVGLWRQFAV
jgi:hypothetical protein